MTNADALEKYMLELINADRTSRGLSELKLETNLNQSAEDHSEWMLRTDEFSHTGARGSSATDRMRAADFDFSGSWRSAENIAVQSERGASGFRDDVKDLHTSLMNSPGHRANLLNPDLDYIGIGIEVGDFTFGSGRTYESVIVTQNFATTQGSVDLDGARSVTPPATTTATTPTPAPVSSTTPDAIRGSNASNVLFGTSANDIMFGYGGNDRIYGRSGNDRIDAGNGHDKAYTGAGNDSIKLGAGNDFVSVNIGRNVLDGGSGVDSISYYGASGRVRIDLQSNKVSGSWASDDKISGFENATGSNKASDILLGSNTSNILRGYGGNDNLQGRAGNDRLFGGNGRDRLDGDAGFDQLHGGKGADVFHFDKGDGIDVIKDFQNNIDSIQLDNFYFKTVGQALKSAKQSGDDVRMNLGNGDYLIIEDTRISMLWDDLVLV